MLVYQIINLTLGCLSVCIIILEKLFILYIIHSFASSSSSFSLLESTFKSKNGTLVKDYP